MLYAVTNKKTPKNRDPEYMKALGRRGGLETKKRKGRKFFSRIAATSHPRKVYKGGRYKKSK
jgi:hypothetical protein